MDVENSLKKRMRMTRADDACGKIRIDAAVAHYVLDTLSMRNVCCGHST